LIKGNFKLNDKFIGLTFKNTYKYNIKNLDDCNKKKNKFILNLQTKYPGVKYILVPEFQKRGAIHYHMICNLPYIDKWNFHKLWKYGSSHIQAVKSSRKIGFYLTKYITKNLMDKKFYGRRGFYASNNLERTRVEYREVAYHHAPTKEDKDWYLVYQAQYNTRFNGYCWLYEYYSKAPT
jgi:hypothetical protein